MKHFLIGALCAGTMAFTGAMVSAETTIRVTLQLPKTHSLGQNWLDFKALIEAKSGGELQLQLFDSAQLFKDKEVPEAVGSGAVEAGSAFLGRFTGAVPAVDVVSIPFIFENETHLRAAVAAGSDMRNALDSAILAETNNKVLWWQAFGRNIYLSNGSAIRTPGDMADKKVRTYGKIHGWTVEALGGAPTLMSGSKQFLAYQQGAVDVGMTGASAVKSRKLYEVMDHMTLSYDSAIEFLAVMNNDFFEGLSAEHQAIIMEAAAEVESNLRDTIYKQEVAAVEEVTSKMTVVTLSAEERAEWVAATAGVVDRFVAHAGDTGAAVVAAVKAAK
ncbi:MAG: TRAP transporter substrate-binding protein DctP [Rhodobacteraceae bacterium]|nr:TRAP transporter substrate-binding protein DctP [Paracoccaceae bacterium]